MGANAQTSVPLFVANSVLTAAQQNISAATGVPVFATTVTRDAAFGGSNKVLAEGQLCYLESTNVVQYYDGAAWATVGPASAGALARVGGGTLAGTSTAFTNVFSATYDAYRIIVSNASVSDSVQLKLGSTAAGYYWAYVNVAYSSGTVTGAAATNTSSWRHVLLSTDAGNGSTTIDLINPFLTQRTTMTANISQTDTGGNLRITNGFLNDATSYTGFTLTPDSGNLTGTCNIYGYSLS
jgi:hypothetical protein